MRIGFLGNMNNYPFILANAFRKLGHEVLFIVDSKQKLNRPEHRYNIKYPYPKWIIETNPINEWILFPHKTLLDELNKCDFVVLNSYAPMLHKYIKVPIISFMVGWDVLSLAKYHKPGINLNYVYTAKQRNGLKKSKIVCYFPEGVDDVGDTILNKLNKNRLHNLMADIDYLKYMKPVKKKKLILLCPARLNWVEGKYTGSNHFDNKRIDLILYGVIQFLKIYKDFELILFNKGNDVKETKKLVKHLKLENHVKFHRQVSQKELLKYYRKSDIVFDTLAKTMIGISGRDALCMGKPLIANARVEIKQFGKNPILHSETANDVFEALKYLKSYKNRLKVSKESRRFIERQLDPKNLARRLISKV